MTLRAAGADESRVYDWLAAGLEVVRCGPHQRGAVQTALTLCLRPAHLPVAGGPPRSHIIRCSSRPQPLHKLVKRTAHHGHFSAGAKRCWSVDVAFSDRGSVAIRLLAFWLTDHLWASVSERFLPMLSTTDLFEGDMELDVRPCLPALNTAHPPQGLVN